MSHGGFAAGTGAAHAFSQMTGRGEHGHPHDHPDLDEIVNDHADHITGLHDQVDAHDARLGALESHLTDAPATTPPDADG